jgi:thiol-disulfide isomerase/thioredoxin
MALLLMAAVTLAVGLAGCLGSDATPPDASAATSSETDAKTPTETPASTESPATDPPTTFAKPVKEGDLAPDFSYTTVDGASGSLSQLKGKVVFLNLWASWCGPCVAEMPDIAALKAAYPELEVLAINISDDPTDAQDFIRDSGYDFNWVIDDERGTIGALYPSSGIPYSVIINRDGIASSVFLGSPIDPYSTYEDALKQAGL